METEIINFKKFLTIVIFGVLTFFGYWYFSQKNKTTKVVFCDVGQGDASYIRIKNQFDLLIDAGPDRKILNCLGKYMPFYDKKIELAIISHPQKDHYGGFLFLLDRYKFEKILIPPIKSSSTEFRQLIEKINQKNIILNFPLADNKINILNSQLIFFWPSKDFLAKNLIFDSPQLNNQVLGVTSLDINYFSLVFLFKENSFKILYTGDAPSLILTKISNLYQSNIKTSILKIPHHGSKNGLNDFFLKLADPTLAVISVSSKNSFGHPHQKVLEMLKAQGIKIRRTDIEGDIFFKLKVKN